MKIFDFKKWENQKVAMHCKTEKEAKDFCRTMHNSGMTWCDGEIYIDNTEWYVWKEKTCYFFNEGAYDNLTDSKLWKYIILEWSDYMNKTFRKSDLKNGDVIVRRNGDVEIICDDTGTCITSNEGFNVLSGFNEDLTHYCLKDYDIIDVYRPTYPGHCSFSERLYKKVSMFFIEKSLLWR